MCWHWNTASGDCARSASHRAVSSRVLPGYLPQDSDWSLFSRLIAIVPQDNPEEMAGPENVAGVIAMLVSDDGRFISGTEIRIDGGAHT